MSRVAEITVKGKVQGVGFRYFVLQKALQYNLKGYVQNLVNGNVIVVAEGNHKDVETLIDWLKFGPPKANVTSVKTVWVEGGKPFSTFNIKSCY